MMAHIRAWLSRCKVWRRRRKWGRRALYRTPLEINYASQVRTFLPRTAVGFGLAGTLGDNHHMAFLWTATQPEEFLKVWYALGGEAMFDSEGFAYDPENG